MSNRAFRSVSHSVDGQSVVTLDPALKLVDSFREEFLLRCSDLLSILNSSVRDTIAMESYREKTRDLETRISAAAGINGKRSLNLLSRVENVVHDHLINARGKCATSPVGRDSLSDISKVYRSTSPKRMHRKERNGLGSVTDKKGFLRDLSITRSNLGSRFLA